MEKILKQDWGMDPGLIAVGIGSVLTYIFFEAKLDLRVLAKQPGKWKDPKFWLTVISVVITGIEQVFHLGIPVTEFVTLLTLLVGTLFGLQLKKPRAY